MALIRGEQGPVTPPGLCWVGCQPSAGCAPHMSPLDLIPVTLDTTLGWLLLPGASLRKPPGEPPSAPWLRKYYASLNHPTSCH